MATEVLTRDATEADLEAKINAALGKAFPWLPEGALTHQVRFSFTIGRSTVEVDGAVVTSEGRTDVLVQLHGKPLAVFELKRQGSVLTGEDESQGLSYAKVMNPPYPLVVVTNGDETRILATHTGKPWEPETPSEDAFAKLVDSAGRVAAGALKEAITTLLGSSPNVWMTAVRVASATHIQEMTGDWDEPSRPFVGNFLFPRKATLATLDLLGKGYRFFLLHGAPLVGKSSVLRELTVRSVKSEHLAVLFVDANEGRGIFQAVADLLAAALSWPITVEEAREWLRMLSHADGPALALAVDGIGPDHDAARRELEDLSSSVFGRQLRLIVAADDGVAAKLLKHPNGRQDSAIARRVEVTMGLGLLDDEEFDKAEETLWSLRMGLQKGAASALELRVPWVLRALGGQYAPGTEEMANHATVLPAQLSLDIVGHTRKRFPDPELRREFFGLARAVLDDAVDPKLPLALKLESMATFVVRREILEKHLDRKDIDDLMSRGYLKSAIHESGAYVLYVSLPELLASEASRVLAEDLTVRAAVDINEAAEWLVATTCCIPLGDIIAAYAFADIGQSRRSIPLGVVHALTDMPPNFLPIAAGLRAATHIAGVGTVDLTFDDDGSITYEVMGEKHKVPPDPDQPSGLLGNHHPWMILSHLAGLPMEYGDDAERLDLSLLGIVGSSSHVLRRPDDFMSDRGVATHNIAGYGEVLCHAAGIVEPVTLSIYKMLTREGPAQEEWIHRAIESESLGLLARIDVALREIERHVGPTAKWASAKRRELIGPALSEAVKCAAE
jgi:hypothetical protein